MFSYFLRLVSGLNNFICNVEGRNPPVGFNLRSAQVWTEKPKETFVEASTGKQVEKSNCSYTKDTCIIRTLILKRLPIGFYISFP